jgi:hypothetical protein
MNIQLEEYLSELTQLQNERMVNEHGLRSEILRPYISEETGPMLHFVTVLDHNTILKMLLVMNLHFFLCSMVM